MKSPLNLTLVSAMMIAVFSFATIFTPSTAKAGWHPQDDNLPGMHEFPTGLVVLTAVVAVGAVTYLIVKKNKSDKQLPAVKKTEVNSQATEDAKADSINAVSSTSPKPDQSRRSDQMQSQSKPDFCTDVENSPFRTTVIDNRLRLSDLALKAGFALGF